MAFTDSYLNLYNPGNIPREQFLAETSARGAFFEALMADIRNSTDSPPPQHHLVIGPRGMGKTSVLYMVKYLVEDDARLGGVWLPLLFDEEEYGIGDLADFWLECIRTIEDATEHTEKDSADELLLEKPDGLEERALALFLERLGETGKRALLLIDNLNDLFKTLDEEAQHRLRALLMEDERFLVVGTAASWFSAVADRNAAFFEFFRSRHLERFEPEEMERVLRQLAELREDDGVLKVIEEQPERLKSLRVLTGGNPRLVKMIYSLLSEGLESDARQDLERLLDECTPFFKHRIEALPLQARRVFDRIARHWDPIGVAEIAPFVRKAPNYVSSVIKKLIDDGFVEEAGGSEKRRTYQVAERFYNIYYLMRFSREGRNRLRYLVSFMRVFYAEDDYARWLAYWDECLAKSEQDGGRDDGFCYLASLAEAAGDAEMKGKIYRALLDHASKREGYRKIVRLVNQEDLREALADSEFDLLDYLKSQPEEKQREFGFQPDSVDWWCKVGLCAFNTQEKKIARKAYQQAANLDRKSPAPLIAMGILGIEPPEISRVFLEQALQRNPTRADIRFALASVLTFGVGDLVEGRVEFEKLLASEKDYRESCLLELSRISFMEQKFGEALAQILQVLVCPHPSPLAQKHFINCFARSKNACAALIAALGDGIENGELGSFLEEIVRTLVLEVGAAEAREIFDEVDDLSSIDPLVRALDYLVDENALERVAPEIRTVALDVAERLTAGSEIQRLP